MTFFRQLILALLVLFIVLYAGNIAVSLHNNKLLVSQQMQVHAQDTATSLGLSMTLAAQSQDIATLDTMFNAVSDSGYFQRIYFTDLRNNIVIDREFPVSIEGIPQWFVSAIELPVPTGKALVGSGWTQLGELTVVSHPGQAYQKLWQTTTTQLLWFALVTVLVCIIAWFCLSYLLIPLRRVERQAEAICQRQFEVQERLPKTRELRRVVEAMNRMSRYLKALFTEQLVLINRLRELSTSDDITGLSNRSDFDVRLKSFLSPETGPHSGVLLIVRVLDLKAVNDYAGRSEGNALLAAIAEQLKAQLAGYPQRLIARRQGAEFVIFVPDIGEDEADEIATKLFNKVRSVNWSHAEQCPLSYKMGVSFQALMTGSEELLTEADVALREAQKRSGNHWLRFTDVSEGEAPILSKPLHAWHDYLQNCITNKTLMLYYQPIFQADGVSIKGHEVYVRFPSDCEVISAGMVVPIAERLGLMPKLDLLMLEKLADLFKSQTLVGKMVVNLSLMSLQNEDFMASLAIWLSDNQSLASQLVVEVAEYAMDVDPTPIRDLQQVLRKQNAELGIDHFGLDSTAFGYLGSLALHHIKVHRSFISKIETNEDNQFYIRSLCQLAHNSDIELWVEGVETKQEVEKLRTLSVDAIQGYFLGKPAAKPVEEA